MPVLAEREGQIIYRIMSVTSNMACEASSAYLKFAHLKSKT
jgi:hypothetical protein